MKRGITFEIPNEYGHFAADILKPFPISSFTWLIGDGEVYITDGNQLDESLSLKISKSLKEVNCKKSWRPIIII